MRSNNNKLCGYNKRNTWQLPCCINLKNTLMPVAGCGLACLPLLNYNNVVCESCTSYILRTLLHTCTYTQKRSFPPCCMLFCNVFFVAFIHHHHM